MRYSLVLFTYITAYHEEGPTGWTLVQVVNDSNSRGFVPTQYIRPASSATVPATPPVSAAGGDATSAGAETIPLTAAEDGAIIPHENLPSASLAQAALTTKYVLLRGKLEGQAVIDDTCDRTATTTTFQ